MRYLLFILAFPILVQAQTKKQQCDRLTDIASQLEKSLQTKMISKDCESLPPSKHFKIDYRCKDLATIDLQLKTLENEYAMFSGVEKLRNETLDAKGVLDKTQNKSLSASASKVFYDNLKIAATVEGLLETTGIKDEILLSELAGGTDDDLSTHEKFTAFVGKTCVRIGVNKGNKFCDNPKALSQDEMKEVSGLVLLGRKNGKFSPSLLKELKQAMAIESGDKPYKFATLLSEITAPAPEQSFSEKDLQKLAAHKLSPKTKSFDFLDKLSRSTKTIQDNKEVRTAQGLPHRFQEYFTGLKSREEYELKAKLSVILNELKDYIPEAAKAACAEARTLSGKTEECLNAISGNKSLQSVQRNSAMDILLELKVGQEQIKRLDHLVIACSPNEDMTLHSECEKYYNGNTDELLQKADELRAIKEQILGESKTLMEARDAALHTIVMKGCFNVAESNITCDDPNVKISREVMALSDSSGEIILMLEKPATAPDLPNFCKTADQSKHNLADICKFVSMNDNEDSARKPAQNAADQSPIEAPQGRNVVGQSWADMLGGLGQTLGNFLAPRQQMINPYQSMFPSSNLMGQPRDIKNQIMDPYMATGFGGYAPTSGLRPYSSVNSNMGISSAYNFGASSFFNSPVGW